MRILSLRYLGITTANCSIDGQPPGNIDTRLLPPLVNPPKVSKCPEKVWFSREGGGGGERGRWMCGTSLFVPSRGHCSSPYNVDTHAAADRLHIRCSLLLGLVLVSVLVLSTVLHLPHRRLFRHSPPRSGFQKRRPLVSSLICLLNAPRR